MADAVRELEEVGGSEAYFARADDLTLPDRVRIRFAELKERRTLLGKPDSPQPERSDP